MEYWKSWILSSVVVLIGIVAKFLLEIYLPEFRRKKINIKRTGINGIMTVLLLYLLGTTMLRLFTEPWSEDLKMFTLFQAFLFIAFVSFLMIMRILRIFFTATDKDSKNKSQKSKGILERILMQ